jgi:2-haloacid dehalogenase
MLDFSRFEILTFDCYGTLIDWEEGILGCLRRILAAHGQQIDDATILRLYADFEASAEQGEYRSYREVLNSVVRQFGKQFGFIPSEEQVRSLADSLKEWKPWPDTVEAIRSLESR